MEIKEKLHKKIHHIHKRKFTWLLLVVPVLVLAAVLYFVNSDRLSFSTAAPGYQSVEEEEGHDGYEEPAEGEYKEVIIRIKDGKFVPDRIEVAVDTLIIFENEENVSHAVVSDNVGNSEEINFDTGELPYEERVPTVEYGIPGTYAYHDKLNPHIKGTIVVK